MIDRGQRAWTERVSAGFCAAWIWISILLPLWTGCSYLRPPASRPKAQVKSLQLNTNGPAGPVTVRSLQIEVMRFADNYAAATAHAADEFNAHSDGAEARLAAVKWKLDQATAAYIDASGPNPVINALDMVVLATASRMVMDDRIREKPFGEAALPLLATHRMLETGAWSLVSAVLKPEQQGELREIIQEWRRNNPQQRDVTALRFREFMSALGKGPERASSSPGSLFGLFFLDPMASMDPATAAIEETRNTAERAMYYTQRMPTLLNWQVELLTYELALQPETKQLLGDTDRFSKSTEAFAKTAEQLPKVINEQREAAIKQVLEGLVPEEKKAKELLVEARAVATEAREALKAGGATAESVNATLKTLDEFVRAVSKTNETTTATNRRPFDVLDYGTAASQIGAAAKELNALLASANDSAVRLEQIRKQTAAEANAVVDHAFGRGLILVLALLVGGLLAGILYRVVTGRLRAARVSPQP